MENCLELANELKESFLKSSTYVQYLNAKEILYKNPEIFEMVKELKNLQSNDRFMELDNYSISLDREKHLSKLQSDLSLNKVASDFLVSEKNMLNFFDKIISIISKDIEVDFFDIF